MTAGSRRSFQSIIAPVPEADQLVAGYRADGDWSTRLGVPPHVTIAGPWPLTVPVTDGDLSSFVEAAIGISYELGEVGMVGDAVSLFPSDEAPLLELRERALAVAGTADGVDQAWRLHLTVTRVEDADRIDLIRRELEPHLPILCSVKTLRLVRLLPSGRVETTVLH